MPDFEKLEPIAHRVLDLMGEDGDLSGIGEKDRVFLLLWKYASTVDNDGHEGFLEYPIGPHREETVEALRTAGLDSFAELLDQTPWPLADDKVAVQLAALREIDDRYFALGGGETVYAALEKWVL